MAGCRIHTGASGSGTSTLGPALAGKLAVPHHDTDDDDWLPTDPPYATARPAAARLLLMQAMFAPRPTAELAAAVMGARRPGRVTAPDPGAISLEPTDHGVPPA